MKIGWRVTLALMVALVPAAFWLGRESTPPPDVVRPPAVTAQNSQVIAGVATLAPAGQGSAAVSERPPASPQPLPTAGTPLTTIYEDLAARARAGDVPAACRLGAELMRCRAQRRMAGYSQLLQKSLDTSKEPPSDNAVDALALLQESTESTGNLCAGVSDQQMDEAIEFQRLAAERGDERMRLWYATAPALDRERFLTDLELWAQYRAVAPVYLQEALAAGDPSAPAYLQQVYAPRGSWVPGADVALRQPDEHLYFVYRELSGLLHPAPANAPAMPAMPAGMVDMAPQPSPDVDMVAVRAEAEQLRQKYYSNYLPSPPDPAPIGIVDMNDPKLVCGQ